MLELAPGWKAETDRGPGWLFMRLHGPENGDASNLNLAKRVLDLMSQNLTDRVVLELDCLQTLRSGLLSELLQVQKGVANRHGVFRICGLTRDSQEVMKVTHLESEIDSYENRHDAVMAHHRPGNPR